MIALSEFWGDNYYGHPPLTASMVEEAERQLGVKLPVELVSLLKVQNGGYTKRFAHPMTVPTTWSEGHVPLRDLFGIVTDEAIETAQNILSSADMTEEWGLPPMQILLSGDGHWWITLDYRTGASPKVSWIDAECGEDIEIAPSFQAFLEGLVPESACGGEDDS
jgi:hypothetical protein